MAGRLQEVALEDDLDAPVGRAAGVEDRAESRLGTVDGMLVLSGPGGATVLG